MEVQKSFRELEGQISDMLDKLDRRELLSSEECRQMERNLKSIRACRSEQEKREKPFVMEVKMEKMIRSFNEAAEDSMRQLQGVLAQISGGRVPTVPEMDRMNTAVSRLREQYTDICRTAVEILLPEELPQEGSPANAYAEAVKNSKVLEYRRQLDAVRSTLEKFVSVQSFTEKYAKELAPYQEEAHQLMQSIDAAVRVEKQDVEVLETKNAGPTAFLNALACPDYETDEGEALLDLVSEHYSRTVERGISFGKYSLPVPEKVSSKNAEEKTILAVQEEKTSDVPKNMEEIVFPAEEPEEEPVSTDVAAEEPEKEPERLEEPSEKERWHRIGIDNPESIIFEVADDELTVDRSAKETAVFSAKRFETDIKRNGSYRNNVYALLSLNASACISNEMLSSGILCHGDGGIENIPEGLYSSGADYGRVCENLLSLGYVTKYSLNGAPSFYSLSPRGEKIFSTHRSAQLLKIKQKGKGSRGFVKDTAATALTRVLFLHTFSIAAKMQKGKGDEAPIHSTGMLLESFFSHFVAGSSMCGFIGIVSNRVEDFERLNESLTTFKEKEKEEGTFVFKKFNSFMCVGLNRGQAAALATYIHAMLYDELKNAVFCYYDYETKTCYRFEDDSIVSLSELFAEEAEDADRADVLVVDDAEEKENLEVEPAPEESVQMEAVPAEVVS